MGEVPAVAALNVGLLVSLALLSACDRGADGDCEAMDPGMAREECRYQAAKAAVGDDAALRAALDRIGDPNARDLVVLRLAVDTPERAPALCALTRTPVGRDKCDKVLGRPHLGGGGPGAAGSGPETPPGPPPP